MLNYRRCIKCVMDTTDPDICFDADGVCSHCKEFSSSTSLNWHPDERGKELLEDILKRIRDEGRNQEYDSILGLSGGVDSSFLAMKMKDWGLKPLVVHVDAGWNSELAVANIEKVIKYCNYDLHTHVVDWEEMRDLHISYLRAGVPNQDVPQDHVFFSTLYNFAVLNKIRYVFSGGNIATEGVFPSAWHASAMDELNLRAIHKKFGSVPLRTYSTISFFNYYFWFPIVKRMRTVRPLNYMPYEKEKAISEMQAAFNFRPYDRKHGESLFTKVFQNYYLPVKFGFDKRLPHLSSLIVSGQLKRSDALKALEEPLYDPSELENDLEFLCKKLRITRAEFDNYMKSNNHSHNEYPSWEWRRKIVKDIQKISSRILGKSLRIYS